MATILKNDFIDHTDSMRLYKKGSDVSHLDDVHLDFLSAGGNLEDEDYEVEGGDIAAKAKPAKAKKVTTTAKPAKAKKSTLAEKESGSASEEE